MCGHACHSHMWPSEDSLQGSVVSYQMDSGDWTQIVNGAGKCLFHRASPAVPRMANFNNSSGTSLSCLGGPSLSGSPEGRDAFKCFLKQMRCHVLQVTLAFLRGLCSSLLHHFLSFSFHPPRCCVSSLALATSFFGRFSEVPLPPPPTTPHSQSSTF